MKLAGNKLIFGNKTYRCAIGKGGFTADKTEGDGCTPLGVFALRECWYRADRIAPPVTALPMRIIARNDGWCDDPESADYNRHITLVDGKLSAGGELFSFEHLWRQEHVYDLIVPLGYNDDPVVKGKGSAIFMHVAKPGYLPTEGCVALVLDDLRELLRLCAAGTKIEISAA